MCMTAEQVVWFANHKYGESAYYFRSETEIQIWTAKSKWRILLNDLHRFGHYTLFHLNHATDGIHYHKQSQSRSLDFLAYYAVMHDLEDYPYGKKEWLEFQRLWDMYCLGRELEESCARFAFLSEEDWYLRPLN